MKKILIATTALVATTAVASAAELKLSGSARGGVYYDGEDWAGSNRMRLNVDAITETDAGVKLEARVRMEARTDAGTNDTDNATDTYTRDNGFNNPRIGLSYGGLVVRLGNADGAIDNMSSYYGVSTIGFTDFVGIDAASTASVRGYSTGAGATSAVYGEYALDAFAIRASHDMDADASDISADFSLGGFSIGVGYYDADTDGYALAASWSGGALSIAGLYTNDSDADTGYGIDVSFDVSSALNIGASYADGDSVDEAAYGIGASYGLGGGVTLGTGIGSIDGETNADFGVKFSF